jgi:predicted DNA-binding transcriptional regulator YafY
LNRPLISGKIRLDKFAAGLSLNRDMRMKHSRISRVVKILTTLQSGQKYSPADLEKLLGISRRTVFRDLKELQSIGVPYRYDAKSGGYSIDRGFFLPPVDFSLAEALSLLMLVHKMRNHLPMPFRNSALLAGLKIENNLPADVKNYCQTSLAKVTISPAQHTTIKLLDSIYDTIQKAIRKKAVLSLSYHSLHEQDSIETLLRPYHLLYKNRSWYILGFSSLHKSVRTFNLARIKSVTALETRFTDGAGFDLNEYLGRAWSLIPEGRLYDITLRFSPMVAHNVAEVQWHSTQRAQWEGDGSITLNFRVDGLGEISWWILGYGDQVQILAPAALRKKVLERAQKMLDIHKKL